MKEAEKTFKKIGSSAIKNWEVKTRLMILPALILQRTATADNLTFESPTFYLQKVMQISIFEKSPSR